MEEIVAKGLVEEAAAEAKASSRKSSARSQKDRPPSAKAPSPGLPKGSRPGSARSGAGSAREAKVKSPIPINTEGAPPPEIDVSPPMPEESFTEGLLAPRERTDGELSIVPEGESEVIAPAVQQEIDELTRELDKIRVELPPEPKIPEEVFSPSEFPRSYAENSHRETLVLAYAENFRKQYTHLYRDRKPLLLNPLNELNVEKFICTTVLPTKLPYKELYAWERSAEFVSDYLNFVPLDPPFQIPRRMFAPATVLKRQKGNVFECATILCSLLVGVGYDAYVVSGYATREACMADETREDCPLLIVKEKPAEAVPEKPQKKYSVRPARDLNSKHERMLAKRKVDAEEAARVQQWKDEHLREMEAERPPPDPLFGQRVHSWVLVLPGRREVPSAFFIDALTGVSHATTDGRFLGIESLWNHKNYWVNMQDCSEGCKNLKFDLGDPTQWEFMFPSNDKPELLLPGERSKNDFNDDELEETKPEDIEKHMDLPPSWSLPIKITPREYEMRCPHGRKTKLYRKAKLEKFAPYLLHDGLVARLSVFSDREMRDLKLTRELFSNRADKLNERVHDHDTGWITEHFMPGHYLHLKEHRYQATAPGPQNNRTLTFYGDARVDGLYRREETPLETVEHFRGRPDLLYFRQAIFNKRTKKFGPADDTTATLRPIRKVVERFGRKDALSKNEEEVAERVFALEDEKLQLRYHIADGRIAPGLREFSKAQAIAAQQSDRRNQNIYSTEIHSHFMVDPLASPKKNLELFYMFVNLLKVEQEVIQKVRDTEEETVKILNERASAEASSNLDISVYDTERNEKAKKHRRELEAKAEEERRRQQETEQDYLGPFVARRGNPDTLFITQKLAFDIREDALNDLKTRLIAQANMIQARFERATNELQRKEAWYQENQVALSHQDEEEYLNFCRESMFRIHILEQRLKRHKETAPIKYMELESRLRNDPRLANYLNS